MTCIDCNTRSEFRRQCEELDIPAAGANELYSKLGNHDFVQFGELRLIIHRPVMLAGKHVWT